MTSKQKLNSSKQNDISINEFFSQYPQYIPMDSKEIALSYESLFKLINSY